MRRRIRQWAARGSARRLRIADQQPHCIMRPVCGLVGWLAPPGSDPNTLDAAAERMAATLSHRGPDDAGRWTDAQAGIALGFRRLSILDLSAAGHQPMVSSSGRYVCVFNGEIYNHRDLRSDLEFRGVRFRGTSDTEVLVEAADAYGAETVMGRLWGMFALAIWDRVERSLLVARDRLGKKPLHVARIGDSGWLFASELKAFHAMDCFRRDLDPAAVATYLRFGYVPAPSTIFRDAWKLEPGTFSVFRFGRATRSEPYWSARAVARRRRLRSSEPAEEAASVLDRLLRDAVSRRMVADVPLGALLSGGIDSSTVTALMQAQSARPVKTFSIGFREREYDEAGSAAAVARHLGTDHAELYVSADEARDVLPDLAEIYDEPFADASSIPTFLVSRLAKRFVTVALSGDGGDEVFAGYRRYRTISNVSAVISAVPRPLRRPAGAFLTAVPLDCWNRAWRLVDPAVPARWRQRRFGERVHHAGVLFSAGQVTDDLYWRMVSLWPDPDALGPGLGPGRVAWESSGLDLDVPDFRERMTLYDLVTYLPDDILVKVDRAGMAASIEVRSPLLDHRVVEWAWNLPFAMKQRRGASKWLLRQVLYRYVPPHLVDRPKAGFSVPLDRWLRGPLRDWAEHLLRSDRIEEAGLRPVPVRDAWRRHLSGRAEEHRLWVILMLLAWKERWS